MQKISFFGKKQKLYIFSRKMQSYQFFEMTQKQKTENLQEFKQPQVSDKHIMLKQTYTIVVFP